MTQTRQPSATAHGLSAGARVIFDVAKCLFAEKGFNAISINDIAEQAGISKANVFHHFTSKESLYLKVIKAACEDTVGNLTEPRTSGDAGENLWRFFSSQLAALLQNRDSAKLILREIM